MKGIRNHKVLTLPVVASSINKLIGFHKPNHMGVDQIRPRVADGGTLLCINALNV
ncbi:hypothetical protein [Kordiimonas sp.]|uniref:hypothetical protein n=1 Tax=Kordiimonas sp. TaxID=1970157 RepID=UPI003B518097